MVAITHEIIEQYLNNTLKPQLAALYAPDAFSYTIRTVREQMLSAISHWNDVPFRKALLIIGEEEGSFYLPNADLDIRKFVVVTLRNSALESLHADNSQPTRHSRQLTPEDLKAITSAAIEYFMKVDFQALSNEIGLLENDIYGDIAKKYPASWMALTQIANTTRQVIEYEPVSIIEQPNLNMLKPQTAVSRSFREKQSEAIHLTTADGYSMTIDQALLHLLKAVIENDIPFVGDGFKAISRNIEKLLAVMEYILGHDRMYITTNFLIKNGYVERRLKPLKPANEQRGIIRNWMDAAGLAKQHKSWLKAVTGL